LEMYRLCSLVFQPGGGPAVAVAVVVFVAVFGLSINEAAKKTIRISYVSESSRV
jgi:hypothetical protein